MDTPGLADNRKIIDFDLYATLVMALVDGANLILYVISVAQARFDIEDVNGLKMIERIVGTLDNTYIVLN